MPTLPLLPWYCVSQTEVGLGAGPGREGDSESGDSSTLSGFGGPHWPKGGQFLEFLLPITILKFSNLIYPSVKAKR